MATTTPAKKKPAKKKTTTTTEVVNTPKRKYKKKKQVTLLSEILNPARAKSTMNYIVSGGIGYYTGKSLANMLGNQTAGNKAAIIGAIAFGVGNYMDLKAVSAGLAHAAMLSTITSTSIIAINFLNI